MRLKTVIISIILILLMFVTQNPCVASDKKELPKAPSFSKDSQIQQVKPKKPIRIKLHRNAKGEYTWDITGDNPDEIVKADNRLRRLLKLE
ncbi:MAG: hypothetical protein N3A62_02455 [Thermodesulfovibrionales bacterium]|nr:hypothetical protein [Thermodesulfovibrionales bacterium]